MKSQLRQMTKEELHKIIDDTHGDKVMVLTLRKDSGISKKGKMLKKRRLKNFINKAKNIILFEAKPIRRIDLEGNFSRFSKRKIIIKTILLPQIE